MSKNSAGLYIEILSCVRTAILAVLTLIDFCCFVKWRNNLSVPPYLLVIFDTALLGWECACK